MYNIGIVIGLWCYLDILTTFIASWWTCCCLFSITVSKAFCQVYSLWACAFVFCVKRHLKGNFNTVISSTTTELETGSHERILVLYIIILTEYVTRVFYIGLWYLFELSFTIVKPGSKKYHYCPEYVSNMYRIRCFL